MLVSCSSEEITEFFPSSDYIDVPASINISGDDPSTTLNIKSNCAWQISSRDTWLTVSPLTGNGTSSVSVTATQNPSSLEQRTSSLTVNTADGQSRNVTVIQNVASEILTANVETLSFDYSGGMKSFAVQSNGTWEINGSADWITLSRTSGSGNGEVSVQVALYNGEADRSLTLTIHGATVTRHIVVTQSGLERTLALQPDQITVGCKDTETQFHLTGNAGWVATSSQSWAVPQITSGEGDADVPVSLTVNASEKPREAIITITTTKGTLTCTITQRAASLPGLGVISISNIGKHTAAVKGTYTSDFEVTRYGVCYNTTGDPKPGDSEKIEFTDGGLSGEINVDLDNLTSGITYYVRTYAYSEVGYSESFVSTFTTGGSLPGDDDNVSPEI